MIARRFHLRGTQSPGRRIAIGVWLVLSAAPEAALAHGGVAISPERWWAAWNGDPVVLLNLALVSWLYVQGWRRLFAKAGRSRPALRRRAVAFALGIAAVVAALVSPLDALSDQLSAAHMVQHMLLMQIAAPLLVLAAPGRVLPWSFDRSALETFSCWRLRLAIGASRAGLGRPLLVWMLFAVTLWLWHWPGLYQAALRRPVIHDLQHLAFFATACLFWRVLFVPGLGRGLSLGMGVMYLFTTSLHATMLGVLMTLAPQPWYGDYLATAPRWNLTALEDQQLAGLIMWMPGCAAYALAAIALVVLWLQLPLARWQPPVQLPPADARRSTEQKQRSAPIGGLARPALNAKG